MAECCLVLVGSCGLEGLDRCGTGSQGKVGFVKPSDAVTPPSFPVMDGSRTMNISGPSSAQRGRRDGKPEWRDE